MTPKQTAARMIARLNAGFPNEFAWQAWLKKSKATILALPLPLRKAVLLAWEQATAVEFSGGPSARLSRGLNGSDAEAGPPIPDANEK